MPVVRYSASTVQVESELPNHIRAFRYSLKLVEMTYLYYHGQGRLSTLVRNKTRRFVIL